MHACLRISKRNTWLLTRRPSHYITTEYIIRSEYHLLVVTMRDFPARERVRAFWEWQHVFPRPRHVRVFGLLESCFINRFPAAVLLSRHHSLGWTLAGSARCLRRVSSSSISAGLSKKAGMAFSRYGCKFLSGELIFFARSRMMSIATLILFMSPPTICAR
jgi:hypothetical protein